MAPEITGGDAVFRNLEFTIHGRNLEFTIHGRERVDVSLETRSVWLALVESK